MDYKDCYELIKNKFMEQDMSAVGGNFSALLYLTGQQESGYIYAAYIDGCKIIEPVRHPNVNIFASMTISIFEKIITQQLDPFRAFTTGQIKTKGNVMLALSLYNTLKQSGN